MRCVLVRSNQLKGDGYEPILTTPRWLLLKRPENLTDNQETKLADSYSGAMSPLIGPVNF